MDAEAMEKQVVLSAEKAAARRTGVVLAARTRDGGTAYAGAGATREGGPTPDEHSLFEIGSITKTFTALLLADEVVNGRLDLDQPVAELLPGVDVPARDGRPVTLAHLATHTSGLPRVPLGGVRPWMEFARGRDPYVGVTPDALLHRLERTKLKRTPGTPRVAYSNFGYGVLGEALVRHCAAPDYHALVTERICRPLGLGETFGRVPDARAADVAQGHRSRRRRADRWLLTGIAGAGVLVSSASDLVRYLEAQLEPDATPLAEALRLTHQERVGGRSGIGLAWMRPPAKDGQMFWHNGGTGGFRSFVGFVDTRGTAVVALSNQSRGLDLVGLGLLAKLESTAG